jgi:MFS family permease
MVAYIGITIGDVVSGLMSQRLKSRKKVLLLFISLTFLLSIVYYLFAATSVVVFYTIVFCIGFATGYWAVFMSSASELFGTNIRATVTTTAPNFVRGAVTLMTFFNGILKPAHGFVTSSLIIGSVVFLLAYLACFNLEETFNKDLNYTE